MGRVERWDLRSQQWADVEDFREREDPRWWVRLGWALVAFLAVGRLLVRVAADVGVLWVGVPVAAVVGAALVVFLVREQRRHRGLKVRHAAEA